ncbi:hypothetical protein [Streptomyces sp. cmx-4-7]|uniref:hypothetical protein n=1 Tax=Streptomyces sp. cmx-4-7 TaxID=2790939 RepID=UPI003980DE0B
MCHPAWARARTEAQRRRKDLTGEGGGDATVAGAAETGETGETGKTGKTGEADPALTGRMPALVTRTAG